DKPTFQERSAHRRMERVGVLFTHFLALPDLGDRWFVRIKAKHHRTIVKAREVEQVTHSSGSGDGHAGPDLTGLRPIALARFRVQRVDRFRMPDDELTFAAGFKNHRRTIAWLFGGECPPQFL